MNACDLKQTLIKANCKRVFTWATAAELPFTGSSRWAEAARWLKTQKMPSNKHSDHKHFSLVIPAKLQCSAHFAWTHLHWSRYTFENFRKCFEEVFPSGQMWMCCRLVCENSLFESMNRVWSRDVSHQEICVFIPVPVMYSFTVFLKVNCLCNLNITCLQRRQKTYALLLFRGKRLW